MPVKKLNLIHSREESFLYKDDKPPSYLGSFCYSSGRQCLWLNCHISGKNFTMKAWLGNLYFHTPVLHMNAYSRSRNMNPFQVNLWKMTLTKQVQILDPNSQSVMHQKKNWVLYPGKCYFKQRKHYAQLVYCQSTYRRNKHMYKFPILSDAHPLLCCCVS